MNGEYIEKWDKAIEELMLIQQESLLKPATGGDKKIRPYEEKPISSRGQKKNKSPKRKRGQEAAEESEDEENS